MLTVGRATVFFCWLFFAVAKVAAAAPITLVDDRGATLHWAQPPQRIVSLLPSLTESICALQACERLVGVDRYSNWPTSLAALPRVGGGLDPNIEAIVALRPDVVLMEKVPRVSARLAALGIQTLELTTQTHADVARVLHLLAQLLGLPPAQAQALWQSLDANLTQQAAQMPAAWRQHPPRVYFEVSPAPYAAGAASFIGETLARLGAKNIVPVELGSFPKLNPEFIVRANPDLIIANRTDLATMATRPGWAQIKALREKKICALSPTDAELIARPSPRLGQAATLLAHCLRDPASFNASRP